MLAKATCDYVAVDALGERGADAIDLLRRLGLPIETHPQYGVRLTVQLDAIDRAGVRTRLHDRGLTWPVHVCLETASTNDLASAGAADGAEDGSTWVAEHQTKGRGRLGRSWHSPVGTGIWMSVLRRHDLAIDEGWRVTLGAGLAVSNAIREVAGLEARLKWPNDILIDGRKAAGILAESRADGGRLRHSVVGIGLNVHLDAEAFPPDLRETATSIDMAGGSATRTDLLVGILAELDAVSRLPTDELRDAWSERCAHWGQRVRVERDCEVVEGVAHALGEDGAFVITLDDGTTFSVHAGDVTHVRSAE